MGKKISKGLDLSFHECERTTMTLRTVWLGILLPVYYGSAKAALTLSPCVNQYFEVKEGERINKLTCSGLTGEDTVTWSLFTSTSTMPSPGSCPPVTGSSQDSCKPAAGSLGETFRPTRTSNTSSVLIVDPVVRGSAAIETGSLMCQFSVQQGPSCKMDYIHPAEVTGCSVQFTRWSVAGRCDVSKTYSAQGRYSCQWFNITGNSETPLDPVNMTTSPQQGKYVTATCSMSRPLPTVNGTHSYRVVITPGSVHKNASFSSSNVIEVPGSPAVSCSPSDYVPEDTDISCTCMTSSVGQPAGRLTWLSPTAGNINTVINTGSYGDKTLQMVPQTLRRGDDVREFRCDVEWAATVTGQSHTARVGYAASQVSLLINSAAHNTTVTEGQEVTYACSSSGGRPASNVTLVSEVTGRQLSTDLSPLTHPQQRAECEDGGRYTCTADNGMGKAPSASVTLFVNCAPKQGDSTLPDLAYSQATPSVSFDVTAYPVPDSLLFAYLGPSEANTSAPTADYEGITLQGSCWQGDRVYLARCRVTVLTMQPSAAGLYQVTVSNGQGQAAIFTWKIAFDGSNQEGNVSTVVAVVVSVMVAVIIVIIIIVVVLIIKKRRGKAAARGSARPVPNNPYESEGDSRLGADPDAQSRPLSFSPAPVYAQVNKKAKKPKQAAVPPEADANGDAPTDVYAQVDKTKKKHAGAKGAGKAKTDKSKDGAGHIYSNMDDVKHTKTKKTKPPPNDHDSTGRTVSPDGLVYVGVEIKPTNTSRPKPEEDKVIYSEVNVKK